MIENDKKVSTVVIPSLIPDEFRLQPTNKNCGAYCLYAILKSYNIHGLPDNPEEILPEEVQKSGTTTYINLYPRLLMNYGIYAELRSAQDLDYAEKVMLITRLLSNNAPIMCIVKKIIYPHWETIWGIDEQSNLIYTHDPSQIMNSNKLPVGNTRRRIDKFIDSWEGPGSIIGKGFKHFSYIHIGS